MRKIILFFFFFPLLIKGVSQTNLFNPNERIGDTITVTGRVYAGNYLKNVITRPTFLNVFDSNPSRMLMLRIDSGDRKNFAIAPEKYYLNKKVTVRGVLGDYKGVALLRIVDSTDMVIDWQDKGPEPILSTGTYMSGQNFGFGKSDSLFRVKQDSIKKIIDADPSRKAKQMPTKPAPSIPVAPLPEEQKLIVADTLKSTPAPEAVPAPPANQQERVPEPISEPVQNTPPTEKTIPPAEPRTQTPMQDEPVSTEQARPVEKAQPPVQESKTSDAQTANDDKPDQVRRIRLKNLPVYTRPTSAQPADTSAKAIWLKTISSQEFQPVNDTRTVETDEIEMRSAPTSDAPVIAYIMDQMTILITYKSEKWSYLTVQNPDGSTGMSGFIKNKVYKHLKKK